MNITWYKINRMTYKAQTAGHKMQSLFYGLRVQILRLENMTVHLKTKLRLAIFLHLFCYT